MTLDEIGTGDVAHEHCVRYLARKPQGHTGPRQVKVKRIF